MTTQCSDPHRLLAALNPCYADNQGDALFNLAGLTFQDSSAKTSNLGRWAGHFGARQLLNAYFRNSSHLKYNWHISSGEPHAAKILDPIEYLITPIRLIVGTSLAEENRATVSIDEPETASGWSPGIAAIWNRIAGAWHMGITSTFVAAMNTPTESERLPPAAFELTKQLFPGNVICEVDFDPEWPEDRFMVVTVEVPATATDLIRRRREWHEKVSPLLAGHDVRLSIVRR